MKRAASRAFGWVMGAPLAEPLRGPLYRGWLRFFGGNADEMELAPEAYPSMAQFFIRRLKPGVRPIDAAAPLAARAAGETDAATGHADRAADLCKAWEIPLVGAWLDTLRAEYAF